MDYTGKRNKTCGVCNASVRPTDHPCVLRIGNSETDSTLLCPACFRPLYEKFAGQHKDREIEAFEVEVGEFIKRTKFVIPAGYIIKGHWFVLYNHGQIGLVVNYELE